LLIGLRPWTIVARIGKGKSPLRPSGGGVDRFALAPIFSWSLFVCGASLRHTSAFRDRSVSARALRQHPIETPSWSNPCPGRGGCAFSLCAPLRRQGRLNASRPRASWATSRPLGGRQCRRSLHRARLRRCGVAWASGSRCRTRQAVVVRRGSFERAR
jgi:hypothetical protein